MNMYKNFEGYNDPTAGGAYSQIKKTERTDKRGAARKVKYRRRYSRNRSGEAKKRPAKRQSVLRSILTGVKKASSKVKAFYRKEKHDGC